MEGAFDVLMAARRLEAAGRHVIHLEIGEPDFPTPEHVVEAGVRALRDGDTRYGPPAGLPALREAVAASLRERGVEAAPEQVVVTSGAKPMLFYAMLALVEPGDEVLVPDPGFPIYASVARFAGGVPVPYPLDGARGFTVDPELLARLVTRRTRLLVLNSPHNPTGGVLDGETLARIAALAARHRVTVLSDEIYAGHVYGPPAPSAAAFPEIRGQTVLVDGVSKTYAMTGWRLGWGVMPAALAERVTRMVVNSTSCAPGFVQRAALAALTGPRAPVEAMAAELRARRALVAEGLNRLPGVRCALPAGAFYAFPDVSGLLSRRGLDARGLAGRLLSGHGVACLAGSAFGPGGEGYLRLAYTAPRPVLREALARMAACVAEAADA
jgi:aspartate/methionine/tyrosine aminotransferase